MNQKTLNKITLGCIIVNTAMAIFCIVVGAPWAGVVNLCAAAFNAWIYDHNKDLK
jgi:hypothetical protein